MKSVLPSVNNNSKLLFWLKALAILLFLMWLCISLVRLLFLFVPSDMPTGDSPIVEVASDPESTQPTVDITKLKGIELFGDPPAVAPVETEEEKTAQDVDESAEETRLELSLSGVFANDDDKRAYAIIVKGSDQSLYRVDDEIEGVRNVTLAKVMSDRVILDNNGRSESLMLYPEGEPISSSNATSYVEESEQRAAPARPAAGNVKVRSLSEVIKVSMAREGGQVVGFRVRPGRNREAFNSLGLKANDIVTEVNGVELTSSAKAMEVYRSMSTATDASLKVKRKDQELTVEVSLAALQGQ